MSPNLMLLFSPNLEEKLLAFSSHPHIFDCTLTGLMPILFLWPKKNSCPGLNNRDKTRQVSGYTVELRKNNKYNFIREL